MSFQMRPVVRAIVPLVLSLSVAATAAACGGTDSTPAAQQVPTTPEPAATTDETPETTPPGTTPPVSKTPNVRETIDPTIVSTLKEAGVQIDALPATLAEVKKSQTALRAVMKTFTIALGTKCDGCHVAEGDEINYKAPTKNKAIATKMWANFVRGLKQTNGSAIYCDSCHQGKMTFLDRSDEPALRAWMRANFVSKFERIDGEAHGCATCHGDPFAADILDGWAK